MAEPDFKPSSERPLGLQRVADALAAAGHPHAPLMLSDAARTAQQAADALGVALGQIAKSIIFRRKVDDVAVLVITSGDLRVDEKKVQAIVCAEGGKLGRADAEFVKAKTGFSIGGVSPLAHATAPVTLIDAAAVSLCRHLGRGRPSPRRVSPHPRRAAVPHRRTGARRTERP